MNRERDIIKILLLCLLVPGLLTGCARESSLSEKTEKSKNVKSPMEVKWGNAPDFTLPELEGGNFTLSSLKGKVIVLDFWATRCPPCRMEIPSFMELYKEYGDKGLEIVGLCLENKDTVKPFAEEMGINYILVFADRKVVSQYGGIRYTPTTFIIDQHGNIVRKHVGYTSKKVFEKDIKRLLSKQ